MNMNDRPDLLTRLQNTEYRAAFVSALINSTIAYQIRGLRKKLDLDQADLGALTGMKQTAISRLENPDYGNLSVNTLKRIAKALDIGLVVRFAPYSEVVRWRLGMSQRDMAPVSFASDEMMQGGQDLFHADTNVCVASIKSSVWRINAGPAANNSTTQQCFRFQADTAYGDYWHGSTGSTPIKERAA